MSKPVRRKLLSEMGAGAGSGSDSERSDHGEDTAYQDIMKEEEERLRKYEVLEVIHRSAEKGQRVSEGRQVPNTPHKMIPAVSCDAGSGVAVTGGADNGDGASGNSVSGDAEDAASGNSVSDADGDGQRVENSEANKTPDKKQADAAEVPKK